MQEAIQKPVHGTRDRSMAQLAEMNFDENPRSHSWCLLFVFAPRALYVFLKNKMTRIAR